MTAVVKGSRAPDLAALRAERDVLAAEKARLEDTVRTHEALLTAAAHDLKNSLAAITMRADLLQEELQEMVHAPDESGAASLSGGMAKIHATASNMARLLDELLGLARLQGGQRPDLVRQPVDLVSLVREAIGEYRGQSVHQRIQLATSDESVVGLWDPWRLERVLSNLLNNAVKYSPRGGKINLDVGVEHDVLGRWAVLTIVDHGLGIPAEDVGSVFERFYRGANVRGRIDGSGIGLAGARQIVQEHGGSLEVESEEGVGSTFTLRLPMTLALNHAMPEPDADVASDDELSGVLHILSRCKVLDPIPAAGLARLARQSRIRTFASGATLVQQGHMSESLFLVVDGSVRTERSTDGSDESLVLADLGAGAVIDEMGLLDRAPQTATVTAQRDTLAVEVPATAIAEFLLRYPQLAAGLAGDLHRRLRTADKRKA